ncbi:DUF2332 domain-containing protein [Candidatus Phycosocius spiralis]|uniref:DUF2332 domain-containing protein n=1 Tax=Candidatus Phycosocius spiralis TaxID=2815099 RepID=A0ABQ4PU56_9PROT|nr:DUF2332 domain-containing protein [Candidatus Phycosocius spiralis]GIU66520.1 hypothetical protein PsB1_0674 [Candidatus Phycosocius spiralis]
MVVSSVHAALLQQAMWCKDLQAPFTAALCRAMADDYARGGIVADLTKGWPSHPISDALALRLTGALHYCALKNSDSDLAKAWPRPGYDWSIEVAWALAEATLRAEADWVKVIIQSPPQTNEVSRSVGLWPGLCAAAQGFDGPIDVLELGASAGLNIFMDHFEYLTDAWSWRPEPAYAKVHITARWTGARPFVPEQSPIRHRAACDQNPLDASDRDHRLRLMAYVWPEQFDRLARLESALNIAQAHAFVPDQADAADWLADKLRKRAKDALTVVYHSVFFQYPPLVVRQAIEQTMQRHGAAATKESPLAWLRYEPNPELGHQQFVTNQIIDLMEWPSNQRRKLASIHPHGRSVEWLGA